MPSQSSTVTAEVVRKVAALARLRVPEGEIALWTEQLARIVSYIDQLKEIPEGAFREAPAPAATPVREDAATSGQGQEALRSNAPRTLHDYGVVPRVVASGE